MTVTQLEAESIRQRLGSPRTVPNAITAIRTLIAVALGTIAIADGDLHLLAIAYGFYWVGDILDGWSARRLHQETRLGAVFDIISDRACTSVLCCGLVAHLGGIAPVAIVFLLSFMVLDTMLSLAFLCWPIVSPNDFYVVDRQVWALNWSPLAKATNTACVVGALVIGLHVLTLAIALAVVAVKLWSANRVSRLLEGHDR